MSDDQAGLPPWVREAYNLYLWSLIAWAVGFGLSAVVLLVSALGGGFTHPFAPTAVVLMSLALPGLLYFFIASRRMLRKDVNESGLIYEQIMVIQNLTGIIAIIGAVVGAWPFFAGLSGGLGSIDNLPMMLPWVSLYGFVVTYICALGINRRRKREVGS